MRMSFLYIQYACECFRVVKMMLRTPFPAAQSVTHATPFSAGMGMTSFATPFSASTGMAQQASFATPSPAGMDMASFATPSPAGITVGQPIDAATPFAAGMNVPQSELTFATPLPPAGSIAARPSVLAAAGECGTCCCFRIRVIGSSCCFRRPTHEKSRLSMPMVFYIHT